MNYGRAPRISIHDLTERELMVFRQRVSSMEKTPLIAFLFWFFLGIFGAHRFYMGSTGVGVGMLATAIVGLVTLVIYIGLLILFGLLVWVIIDAFLILPTLRRYNTEVENSVLLEIEAFRSSAN